jgi:hypothetical protein
VSASATASHIATIDPAVTIRGDAPSGHQPPLGSLAAWTFILILLLTFIVLRRR